MSKNLLKPLPSCLVAVFWRSGNRFKDPGVSLPERRPRWRRPGPRRRPHLKMDSNTEYLVTWCPTALVGPKVYTTSLANYSQLKSPRLLGPRAYCMTHGIRPLMVWSLCRLVAGACGYDGYCMIRAWDARQMYSWRMRKPFLRVKVCRPLISRQPLCISYVVQECGCPAKILTHAPAATS